uniref:Ig-like domain-containing protein n=1 Tax=Panthera leo TaxID=9689 RepID=A0A8C9D720_PANLE
IVKNIGEIFKEAQREISVKGFQTVGYYGWGIYKKKNPPPKPEIWITEEPPVENTSPKPTIFLPSIAERKLHKTGTYLCLLEDFFPGVIEVHWKEKNGKTILKSQQGNTMKTKDTYMKYTWLTVSEESMDKEHKCVVKHDSNKGGVDQEILFPSIDKGNAAQQTLPAVRACARPGREAGWTTVPRRTTTLK